MSAPIVIVGAGIAGLALGLALRRRGVDARVIERRAHLPLEGAGIQIGPNGTRCLRALGVFDAVREHASAPEAIVVHDGVSGRELTQLPLGTWIETRHGAPYWVTRRIDLVRALYDATQVAGLAVRFGVDVQGVRDDGTHAVLTLADGATIDATAVIGADGVWSRVRGTVFGGDEPLPTGRVAARAVVRSDVAPSIRRDAVCVWMAPDSHLVCYPVQRGGALNVVLIARGAGAMARWSQSVSSDEIRRRLAAFPESLQLLCAASEWQQWPLLTRTPLAHTSQGRVALVGDAAHPMLPFLAQGAVMALEDALSLAAQFDASQGFAPAALQTFADERRTRQHRVVATAARQGQIYHLAGPMRLARNAVLARTPPWLLMRSYDWLYGARPVGSVDDSG